MSKTDKPTTSRSWKVSVKIIEAWIRTGRKLDELIMENTASEAGSISARIHFLVLGVVRHWGRINALLGDLVKKLPKKRCRAVISVAIYEWLQADEETKPKVIHHAVGEAKQLLSKGESGFVNAVLRRLPEALSKEPEEGETLEDLERLESQPMWWLSRWEASYGLEAVRELAKWNQKQSGVYARVIDDSIEIPSDWVATEWPHFYNISDVDWAAVKTFLDEGAIYIQDPSTRLGVELAGDGLSSVLDLCAAPGGKSIQLLDSLKEGGLLVAVDLPTKRFKRLLENLDRYGREGKTIVPVGADIFKLRADKLPQADFECVYIDVPCSNSGVLQRRPDVKWRQSDKDISQLTGLQLFLLKAAAKYVAEGGSLIYSTCSIEEEENQGVIEKFLEGEDGKFTLEKGEVHYPWKTGHDGCGAFLLRRKKSLIELS